MVKFIQAQFSSLLATAVDFLITVFLVNRVGMYYVTATAVGAISGAGVNFIINRKLIFLSASGSLYSQVLKYAIVWTGSIILNVSGVFLVTKSFAISYIISKIIVAVAVGAGFNFMLQKNFVFKKEVPA